MLPAMLPSLRSAGQGFLKKTGAPSLCIRYTAPAAPRFVLQKAQHPRPAELIESQVFNGRLKHRSAQPPPTTLR